MFSRREKVLLGLAAAAVAAVLGVQLSGGALRAPADPERAIARWQALRQRVDKTESRLHDLTAPPAEVTARMLRAAQASAAAGGVSITSVRPRRPTKTSSGAMEHALEIQAAGRFPGVIKFIFDVEVTNPNLRVARVGLTSSDNESDRVNCTVTIAGYSPGENQR